MINKFLMMLSLVLSFYFTSLTPILASGFYLKSIGSVETGGQQISHWWYTSPNPVFHGEATPGAEVIADIDGTQQSINADSSGNWDYSTSSLSSGDHQITFSSGGSTIKFTLTIGTENVDWDAVEKGGASTLPAAGNTTPTVLILIGGLGMLIWGGKMVFNVNRD